LLLRTEHSCRSNVAVAVHGAQIQRLLQDIDKRAYQIETFKEQQNESQKREENLKRQLDKLTYDKNSLQADLSLSRDQLDEARQNVKVTLSCQITTLLSSIKLL